MKILKLLGPIRNLQSDPKSSRVKAVPELFIPFPSPSRPDRVGAPSAKPMGSIDPPKAEQNGTAAAADPDRKPAAGDAMPPPPPAVKHSNGTAAEPDAATKRRRMSVLPLEVGTRVMCRWRDGKYHPVKVIERRKLSFGDYNDYEYYVHYTECENSRSPLRF